MLSTLSAGPPLSTTHSLALTRPRPTPVAVVCAITATRPGATKTEVSTTHHSLTWVGSPTAFPPISVRLNGDDVRVLAMQCGPVNQSTSSASCLLASPILSPLAKLSYAPYPDRPLHTSVDKNYRFGKLSTPPHAWDSLAPSRVAHHAASNY
ncbi:hypothetical protein BGZ61DRAFT_516598 [Ilyonectria robusta]|uniref:uncharacterized protein n=1 Tax=Ilyonectria robusta TaxID=1079257 RepID=UPI001E8DC43A|nr:uncharacterized protein BGZ61DRAFT_516598 [Ilyonectria robusta]KAH8714350.1 hypothetical protein BGZ61DRAFT_516598 [Ilyonectria robusta]